MLVQMMKVCGPSNVSGHVVLHFFPRTDDIIVMSELGGKCCDWKFEAQSELAGARSDQGLCVSVRWKVRGFEHYPNVWCV